MIAAVAAALALGLGGATPPSPKADPITVGGQAGWQHDEGHAAGYFHTFDALTLPVGRGRPHKVHVFLPRDYARSSKRYPVVYMQDGTKVFWRDGAPASWDLAARLGELYRDHRIPELIVVGINSPDRDEEYTHAPVPTVGTCCGVTRYVDWLADELKPFVDANYRTRSERTATAVVGSSHGGLAAFIAAARHPDVFGMAGAMSPSFWVDLAPFGLDTTLRDSKLLDLTRAGLSSAERPRLWIDWGRVRTGGQHNSLIERYATERGLEMVELLRDELGYERGRDLWWYDDPQGGHEETSWGRRIPLVLEALFGRKSR